MSASQEHDLIVALITRYIQQQGYEIIALESSLGWLFGDSFHLPPPVSSILSLSTKNLVASN